MKKLVVGVLALSMLFPLYGRSKRSSKKAERPRLFKKIAQLVQNNSAKELIETQAAIEEESPLEEIEVEQVEEMVPDQPPIQTDQP